MNYLRIIPSLLLSKGKLLKGVSFQDHKNAGSPSSTIVALESQGADEISLIDIESYINKSSKEPDFRTLEKISEVSSTPITFGGGVTNMETAKKIIRSGAEKIYLNRIALRNRKLIIDLVNFFGGQAIVIGINLIKYKDNYKIFEDLENKINIKNYLKEIQDIGIGEIKINFVEREGKKEGLDLKFSEEILSQIRVSCIFEGGIGNLKQIEDAFDKKISAIGLGTMITFNDYNIFKIKRYLSDKNYNVRL